MAKITTSIIYQLIKNTSYGDTYAVFGDDELKKQKTIVSLNDAIEDGINNNYTDKEILSTIIEKILDNENKDTGLQMLKNLKNSIQINGYKIEFHQLLNHKNGYLLEYAKSGKFYALEYFLSVPKVKLNSLFEYVSQYVLSEQGEKKDKYEECKAILLELVKKGKSNDHNEIDPMWIDLSVVNNIYNCAIECNDEELQKAIADNFKENIIKSFDGKKDFFYVDKLKQVDKMLISALKKKLISIDSKGVEITLLKLVINKAVNQGELEMLNLLFENGAGKNNLTKQEILKVFEPDMYIDQDVFVSSDKDNKSKRLMDVLELLVDKYNPNPETINAIALQSASFAFKAGLKFMTIDQIKYLVGKVSDVNCADENGNTILHILLSENIFEAETKGEKHKELLDLLIEKGADIDKKNNAGVSPRDISKKDMYNHRSFAVSSHIQEQREKYLELHKPVDIPPPNPEPTKPTSNPPKPPHNNPPQGNPPTKPVENTQHGQPPSNPPHNKPVNNPPSSPPEPKPVDLIDKKKLDDAIKDLSNSLSEPLRMQLDLGDKINIELAKYIKSEYQFSKKDTKSIDNVIDKLTKSSVKDWKDKVVDKRLQKAYVVSCLGLLCSLVYLYTQGLTPDSFKSISKSVPGASAFFDATYKVAKICMENKFVVLVASLVVFGSLGFMINKNMNNMTQKDKDNTKSLSDVLYNNIKNEINPSVSQSSI